MRFVYMVFAVPALFLGCSDSDDDHTNGENTQGSVYDAQVQSIDKAKAVEKQLFDTAAKQRKVIEDQGS